MTLAKVMMIISFGAVIMTIGWVIGFSIGVMAERKDIINDILEKGFWKEKNVKIEGKVFLEKEE